MSKTKKKTEKLPILYYIDEYEVKSVTPIGITKDTIFVGLLAGSCYKIKKIEECELGKVYRCYSGMKFYDNEQYALVEASAKLHAIKEETEYRLEQVNEAILEVESKIEED
jgi:hypothetical protein